MAVHDVAGHLHIVRLGLVVHVEFQVLPKVHLLGVCQPRKKLLAKVISVLVGQ